MILCDKSQITGVDNRLTGQNPSLPTVLLWKGYTLKIHRQFLYMHIRCYKSVRPPFIVRPISVTFQFAIPFVRFSYVAFPFYPLLLRFSYGQTTLFAIWLVHSAYDVKGRNSYATPTHYVDLRDARVILRVIFSLHERWPPDCLASSAAHGLQYLPCVFRQIYRQ